MKRTIILLVVLMMAWAGVCYSADQVLLDAVTTAGASDTTFTVESDPTTVMAEGFIDDDTRVLIEKQNIAEDGWLPYAPDGTPLYLRASQQEIIIVGRGFYRVNLLTDSTSEISVRSINDVTEPSEQ
jgi:hypothetical protein